MLRDNFCPHGIIRENCILCMNENGIKPPVQLVKSAPKDLPMPVPNKKILEQKKKMQHSDLYQNNSLLYMPKRLTRKFDLGIKNFSKKHFLFQKRTDILKARYDPELKDKDPTNAEISIIDLRRKFTKF